MYQVTAIYEDSEVGYGEGEGLDYAIQDCIESVPLLFEGAHVVLSVFDGEESRQILMSDY
jgi:hypothetical protein